MFFNFSPNKILKGAVEGESVAKKLVINNTNHNNYSEIVGIYCLGEESEQCKH